MKNLLVELEQKKIPHFITKSFITAKFETTECRVEYHVFHACDSKVGRWNRKDERYGRLKVKILSKFEVGYLLSQIQKYEQVTKGKRGIIPERLGSVYVNKSVKFNNFKRWAD